MSQGKRAFLIGLVVVLFAFVAAMQVHLDPLRAKYQPGKVTNIQLGTQFIAATLIGLKEVVGGLLWVRTDEFFHEGNYDAIIPMVRIVTWLDPHQMNVYETGAWHLSYNFTDSQERSDRRYIPASKALLREGIQNNPRTYDMYFQLGWLNFNKVLDYAESAKWFREANIRDAVDPATGRRKTRPQFVGHTLAHAYENSGDVDAAIRQWQENIRANEEYARRYAREDGNQIMVDVARNNLALVLREKETRAKLTPTYNAKFEAHWERIAPRKFRVWGVINVPNGCRVRLQIADRGFKEAFFGRFRWDIDQSRTILIDDLYVRDGKFNRTIDIERDSAIYPLKAEEYVATFTLDPRKTPREVRDVLGWKGSALAEQPYLVKQGDARILQKEIVLKRSDLL